jgi:hypothetical protein
MMIEHNSGGGRRRRKRRPNKILYVIAALGMIGRFFTISLIVLLCNDVVESFIPSARPVMPRMRCRISMQLAPAHTKEIQAAAKLTLGQGQNLKGLELAHELSTNELSMRPWKMFFDTLVSNKVINTNKAGFILA